MYDKVEERLQFVCTTGATQPNEARFEPLLAYSIIKWKHEPNVKEAKWFYGRLWNQVNWDKVEDRLVAAKKKPMPLEKQDNWNLLVMSLFSSNKQIFKDSIEFFSEQSKLRNNTMPRSDIRSYFISSGLNELEADLFNALYCKRNAEKVDVKSMVAFLRRVTAEIL